MERFPQNNSVKEKSNARELLKASVIAATALIGAPHMKAEALELTPDTSWLQAVDQMKTSVQEDGNEMRFTFLKTGLDTGVWLPMASGEDSRVALEITKMAQLTHEQVKNGEVTGVCIGHTHPVFTEYAESFPDGDDSWRQVSAPPSEADIRTVLDVAMEFNRYGIGHEQTEFFAADPRGIWYYDFVNKSDLKSVEEQNAAQNAGTPEAKEQWLDVFSDLVRASVDPDVDIRQLELYKELQQVYRTNLKANVRFVPYDEVGSEPPCSGVNFKE